MSQFTAEVFQNEYLPAGTDVVDAVVTVNAGVGVTTSGSANAVEIIVIDTSGSMSEDRGAKIQEARRATRAAIDVIRDGVEFAVVGGNEGAYMIYPNEGLSISSPATRAEAKKFVGRVRARGGTAMGTWLRAVAYLVNTTSTELAHCLLLTDGKNQHENDDVLNAAINGCIGLFQCDTRGLGVDWQIDELRRISSALLGSCDIIPSPHEMEAEFTRLTEEAMSKFVSSVALRMWTPKGSQVEFVKQVSPTLQDMTDQAQMVNPLTNDYPLGSWAEGEERDYHIQIRIPVGDVGEERLGARIMLAIDGVDEPAALVRAVWTDDDRLSTRINREVAHYTGQAELADAIAEGLAARDAGNNADATLKLGKAVQLAHEAGNDDTVRLLKKVVDVEDPATGTVRLKRKVEKTDEMALDVRSTRTVRVNKASK